MIRNAGENHRHPTSAGGHSVGMLTMQARHALEFAADDTHQALKLERLTGLAPRCAVWKCKCIPSVRKGDSDETLP